MNVCVCVRGESWGQTCTNLIIFCGEYIVHSLQCIYNYTGLSVLFMEIRPSILIKFNVENTEKCVWFDTHTIHGDLGKILKSHTKY